MDTVMAKRIYCDHAAGTPVDPRVLRAMQPYWNECFANPGAIHKEGVLARAAVEGARASIAEVLGVHADEIVFTGSATESVDLAITGTLLAWRTTHPNATPHVVVSAIEHDAVLESVRRLEGQGVRVTRLPVDRRGVVDIDLLRSALTKETVLVSIMYANNEIGTIQPIRAIAALIRKWKKEVRQTRRDRSTEGDERYPLFHTDATQAANYCDLSIPRLGADLLSMNAAKIYGPKGIGLLAVLRGTPIEPVIVGGGHERGLRAGTENVPAIVGFAEALRIAERLKAKECARLTGLCDHVMHELKKVSGLLVNGDEHERLPNNVHFSLPDVDHEFLALRLDAKGFAVATKSACNETDAEVSHVLSALRGAEGTQGPLSGIRLSFGRGTTKKDVDALLAALRKLF